MGSDIREFSMDLFSLKGKTALITGGNTGMGQGFALALAKAGADIFTADKTAVFGETKELVEKEGRRFEFIQADVAVRNNVDLIADTCVGVYGRLDVLVNNAGILRRNPLLSSEDEDWKAVMDVDLNAVYYLSLKAAGIMEKQGGGKIINIASMYAFQGGRYVPSYTAAKHGVVGITRAFANELSSKNIQINAIAPGYIATNITSAALSDKSKADEITARIPAGRYGTPFDVMGAAVFLAGRASDYVTGHVLAVDGGWLVY